MCINKLMFLNVVSAETTRIRQKHKDNRKEGEVCLLLGISRTSS
jgi:hypothetical protein